MSWRRVLCSIACLIGVAAFGGPALSAQPKAAGKAEAAKTTTAPASTTTASQSKSGQAGDQEQIEQSLQDILEQPATGETYRYDPQGRRDPFRSLVGPTPKLSRKDAPPGVPGFMIDEVNLQGVVKTKDGMIALIKGPDNKGYFIRAGDKLYDGEVLRITGDAVVFRQEVNDPTRIERHREVVKELKSESPKG